MYFKTSNIQRKIVLSVTSLICNVRVKEKNTHSFRFYFKRSYFPM